MNPKKLSEYDEINRIKEGVTNSEDSIEQIKAIYALAHYGNKAIRPITEVMESSVDDAVKLFGYKSIHKIKAHSLDQTNSGPTL